MRILNAVTSVLTSFAGATLAVGISFLADGNWKAAAWLLLASSVTLPLSLYMTISDRFKRRR